MTQKLSFVFSGSSMEKWVMFYCWTSIMIIVNFQTGFYFDGNTGSLALHFRDIPLFAIGRLYRKEERELHKQVYYNRYEFNVARFPKLEVSFFCARILVS